MSIIDCKFYPAYDSRSDLKEFKPDDLLLFALQMRFGIEDIYSVAIDSITEGSDDKKADLIYIDYETGNAVIAQTYLSENIEKESALSNKATDLNTAVSWILNRPIHDLPDTIKPHSIALREGILSEDIKSLNIWYVHNLPESQNVRDELKTVEHTALNSIKTHFKKNNIEIQALEVGIEKIEEWYESISIPILIGDEYTLPVTGGFDISSGDWKAYLTAIPAKWLYDQFKMNKTKLFSANVRDYLGSRNIDRNINNEIKKTATSDPSHFLVYNNGITALVHEYKEIINDENKFINFKGISIVNGAQTTGAIGNLEKPPSEDALVQVRFIKFENSDTLSNIVKFNNSQNKITAPDFRSYDPIQTRLKTEFKDISKIEYLPRRGGHEDIIKRQANTLASITAGQALAAFHGKPNIAYHKKTHIWEDDTLYSEYFNSQTKANHVLFAYSLQKTVEVKKSNLLGKSKNNSLSNVENKQLEFFRKRGSTFLLSSAISNCIETFLDIAIPNKFHLAFKNNIEIETAISNWVPIVEIASSFTQPLSDGLADGFKNKQAVDTAISTFQSLIDSTKAANKNIFNDFQKHVKS